QLAVSPVIEVGIWSGIARNLVLPIRSQVIPRLTAGDAQNEYARLLFQFASHTVAAQASRAQLLDSIILAHARKSKGRRHDCLLTITRLTIQCPLTQPPITLPHPA